MEPVAGNGHAPFDLLIDSLGDACVVIGADGCVTAANDAAAVLYAHAREDLLGRTLGDLCVDDTSAAQVTSCNGSSHSFRARQRRSDGTVFDADITARRAHSLDAGHVMMVVRERESSPCCDELLLRSLLLDNVVDAVVAHTLDGRLLYANRAALDMWHADDVASINAAGLWGWVPPEQRERVAERIERLKTERSARFESHGTRGGGLPSYAEVHARLIDTADGPVAVSVIRDIADRMATEEMVRYLAYHDTLTGLANRTMLGTELAHAISASERHGDLVGLIFIDLDNFKPINDTHGHAIGDDALREVANRLAGAVRETDTVARLGGDEFVVLLPRLRVASDLPDIARKLAKEICRPMELGPAMVTLDLSVGLAVRQPGEDADSFMIRADLAMYESRETGVPGWELSQQ